MNSRFENIELYTWTTPNGYKPVILLEELGYDYDLKLTPLDGAQFAPKFVKINPNSKIPAMVVQEVGQEPFSMFDSAVIAQYLATAEFLPTQPALRVKCLSWLMFLSAHLGPMAGQLGHFMGVNPPVPYATNRYYTEVLRLMDVLEGQLGHAEYVAGAYSIADIALYPWVRSINQEKAKLDSEQKELPNIARWETAVANRPAVQTAYKKLVKPQST